MSTFVHLQDNIFYSTHLQLKIAGHRVELRQFAREFFVGDRPKSFKTKAKKEDEPNVYSDEELQDRRYRRAKRKVFDYVDCNANAWVGISGHTEPPVLITLTFEQNMQDIVLANREFSKFIQRLNLFITGSKKSYSKYLVVIEFQKRGAIHYHALFFNLPYVQNLKSEVARIWGHGFIHLRANMDDVISATKYISKYISKSFDDPRLRGKQCYFVSRGLKQPLLVYYDEIIHRFLSFLPSEAIEFTAKDLPAGFMISLDFTRYNLQKYPEALALALAFLESTGYDGPGRTPPPGNIGCRASQTIA